MVARCIFRLRQLVVGFLDDLALFALIGRCFFHFLVLLLQLLVLIFDVLNLHALRVHFLFHPVDLLKRLLLHLLRLQQVLPLAEQLAKVAIFCRH